MEADPDQRIVLGQATGLRAEIDPHGAQLVRLTDFDGLELQWSGDPAVWSGRAPILFPIIGELASGHYRYNGASYPLARHGFARRRNFAVVERTPDQALLRLAADDDSRAVYPFEFVLNLRYTCLARSLAVEVAVTNSGEFPMPFAFGFHPALRWPLDPAIARDVHAITFAEPEAAPIRRLDAKGLIDPTPRPSPVAGRTLRLEDALFEPDVVIFDQPASRSLRYGGDERGEPRGRQLRMHWENLPLLGVWTKPGADFICIEPWQGLADPEGFTGDIFAKPGIIALEPGRVWKARMTLAFADA